MFAGVKIEERITSTNKKPQKPDTSDSDTVLFLFVLFWVFFLGGGDFVQQLSDYEFSHGKLGSL